jgi:hypothetical protein
MQWSAVNCCSTVAPAQAARPEAVAIPGNPAHPLTCCRLVRCFMSRVQMPAPQWVSHHACCLMLLLASKQAAGYSQPHHNEQLQCCVLPRQWQMQVLCLCCIPLPPLPMLPEL